MKIAAHLFILPLMLTFVAFAEARVQWSEPEVVPEKLARPNRRVIHFSGKAEAGTMVRIKKNQVKLYLDDGKSRWAKIPQKHRVQFPITVDSLGAFGFDLYLPTVAVEIPIQVKKGKGWKTSSLNFRVPSKGKANNFKAVEESFRAADEEISKIDRDENYYSRKNDYGQIIQDRDGRKGYDDSKIEAWGGLGLSYFSMSNDITGPGYAYNASGSTLSVPIFRFGLDWRYSSKILVRGAVRSTSGSTTDLASPPGAGTVVGDDFNWLEAQVGAVWFSDFLRLTKQKLGFDFGIQLQQLPYLRERAGFQDVLYFDNNVYNAHFGLAYMLDSNPVWNYELYGRFLIPLSSGDDFSIDSSLPLHVELGGGIKRPVTQGLSFGVYGQLHYVSMDTSYSNVGSPRVSPLNLMLFTVDARLIANF